jgi:hypothetical protein
MLFAKPTYSNDFNLSINVNVTDHLFFKKDYNEKHISLEYENDNLMMGIYNNSFNDLTYYFGKRYIINDTNNIDFIGLIGYNDGILPTIKYNMKYKNNTFFISPAVERVDEKYKLGVLVGLGINIFKY